MRHQMFDVPHKALRYAFSELLRLAGTTDFSQITEIAALENRMAEVFILAKYHSHQEDEILFADLDRIAPNATQHDRAEHTRLHLRLDDLLGAIKSIHESVQQHQDAVTAGRILYTDLCNLDAEMLIHFLEEERDTQPIFWQYMTDAEIKAFEPRILGSMSPEESTLWQRYIIPTQPFPNLVGMFKGMRATAPPFVFDNAMRLAKSVLSPLDFGRLETAFNPVSA